jgi:hypothetical protein
MLKVLERSNLFPGKEKRGIDVALMLVKTPDKLGVGIPGMEKTLVGMMDCRSNLVADVEIMEEFDEVVMIPPPECSTG